MNDDQILEALHQAIVDECGTPNVPVTVSTVASDIPGWDSLAHVRIMMNLEARLGTVIDIDTTYGASTVGDLIHIIADSNAKR